MKTQNLCFSVSRQRAHEVQRLDLEGEGEPGGGVVYETLHATNKWPRRVICCGKLACCIQIYRGIKRHLSPSSPLHNGRGLASWFSLCCRKPSVLSLFPFTHVYFWVICFALVCEKIFQYCKILFCQGSKGNSRLASRGYLYAQQEQRHTLVDDLRYD